MNMELELDDDGYPTDNTLDIISNYPIKSKADCKELLESIYEIWTYKDYWHQTFIPEDNRYIISTGGWSGNESIIQALEDNTMFWVLCWYSSRRGGHYEFDVG